MDLLFLCLESACLVSILTSILIIKKVFVYIVIYILIQIHIKTAKSSRKTQTKPCLVDLLVTAFLVGAVLNTLITLQIFILYQHSYQFVYSVIPTCWTDKFPSLIILFVIYEMAMPGINWTLLLFFIIIHIVHLLCTRNYLLMLRLMKIRS